MNHAASLAMPLQNVFWAKENSLRRLILFILFGVTVLALASQLSIPLEPVPLTFQSATVILIGMAYGPRYGTYVIATYLFLGACGLPVFADFSAGIAKFFGPTGGYLLGFLPAATFSGYLAQKGFAKTILRSFIAACIGVSLIFFLGVMFLAQFIGMDQAIKLGLMPFVGTELIKLFAVSLLIPQLWKAQGK
jgi:biotin transport system substrate-specific component